MLESRCQQRALIASDASKGILLGLVLGMFSVIFSGWTASMTNMARNMCEQRLVVNYERGHPIFFFLPLHIIQTWPSCNMHFDALRLYEGGKFKQKGELCLVKQSLP